MLDRRQPTRNVIGEQVEDGGFHRWNQGIMVVVSRRIIKSVRERACKLQQEVVTGEELRSTTSAEGERKGGGSVADADAGNIKG